MTDKKNTPEAQAPEAQAPEAQAAKVLIPEPRKGQTILGHRKEDGVYKWFTPAGWAAMPGSTTTNTKGERKIVKKQGFVQVDPAKLKAAPPTATGE